MTFQPTLLTIEVVEVEDGPVSLHMPSMPQGGEDEWRQPAVAHFDGTVELGDDLHRVEVRRRPAGS